MHRLAALGLALCWTSVAAAQQPVTRTQAIETSLSRGGRLAIAVADTSAARARLAGARVFQNPSLSASYSKSPPELHFIVDLPIDLPGLRNARIASALAGLRAADYRYRFEKAAAALDADTTFTRALAAAARARLSERNALAADTLLQMTVIRRDAGDASDLEVELARVNAGQQHNLATADSVELTGLLIDLQAVMGTIAERPTIVLADTLYLPDSGILAPPPGIPLQIASGLESVNAAERNVRVEKKSVLGSPSLMGGVETRDPGGYENKLLPTFGISIPIPLLNRNSAGIAQARAELLRARADLTVTTLEYNATLNRMQRQRATAYARAVRDRSLLVSANRVASMSVTAYRAGAFPLSNVFEAQRTAREVLRQYIDDLAEVWIADANN
ncbi:MAG: TolC family protein, partial [Gemmatimonadales bacterium]